MWDAVIGFDEFWLKFFNNLCALITNNFENVIEYASIFVHLVWLEATLELQSAHCFKVSLTVLE